VTLDSNLISRQSLDNFASLIWAKITVFKFGFFRISLDTYVILSHGKIWRGLGKVTRNHASVSTSTWYYNGRNTVYYDTEDELQETKAALLYKIIQQ
jgi:hypothetical protein